MKYETILRRIRAKIFDYPPHLEEKAMRVLGKVKARSIALLWFAGMCGIASYYSSFPSFAVIAAVLCVASVVGSLGAIVCAIETL